VAPNGSPALMRAINSAEVVRRLRADGPMSRADLVRATGLSKPTVTNVVAHLEELAYIVRVAEDDSGRSNPAPRYEYDAHRGQVLGIDIGADKTLLLLADLAGNVLGSTRFATRSATPHGPSQVFEQLKVASDELLAASGASPQTLLSVVVGTPGVVSLDGVVTMAPQLEGWEGLNLRAALEKLYDCPVSVEGEVALSLQAEGWVGVAQGIEDALFVHLGIGVGAAILVGGTIHRGADGGAGEIGLMPYPQPEPGGATRFVPLESLVGGGALQRRGSELAVTPEGSRLLALAGGDASAVDASAVFAAAREGDAAAQSLVDEAIGTLAWGLSCLICALNPRTVVIGGGMSRSADLFLPQLQRQVSLNVPFAPEWFVSQLGDEAVALGAVNHATQIVESDLFAPFDTRPS
jgi:predicted NBD/HSP70 family sugar kinase